VHFHPYQEGVIIPSDNAGMSQHAEGDLKSSNLFRRWQGGLNEYAAPQIEMVAALDPDGERIQILTYRESVLRNPGELLDDIAAELREAQTANLAGRQEEVLRVLRSYGYEVSLLTASRTNGLAPESLSELVRFAYVPRVENME
jgi:hypothetical protein